MNTQWTEKYRPHDADELLVSEHARKKIKNIIETKNMENIIITGVPGIGKTSTILCIAKKLYGKYYKQGVLELNASDDRGAKTVQEPIVYFCKKKFNIPENDKDNISKHKIILLDEADNITPKAQQMINTLMGKYHNNTRFAFTCNNSEKIIGSIQSRCTILRYKRLSNQQIKNRLKYICSCENVYYTDDGLNMIIDASYGDMRRAINYIQVTNSGYEEVTPETVNKLFDRPHFQVIKNIFISCFNKDIQNAIRLLNELHKNGYTSYDISISMFNVLQIDNSNFINEKSKIKFMKEISRACYTIGKGIDTPLQLTGCIASLCC